MPSTIDIRRRIRSVKNTQQITKAMKMVAAAKLRRAQERMYAARPYAAALREVLASVATRVDISKHPLLEERDQESEGPSSRGHRRPRPLRRVQHERHPCRACTRLPRRDGSDVHLLPIGRKGNDFFKRRSMPIRRQATPGLPGALARDGAGDRRRPERGLHQPANSTRSTSSTTSSSRSSPSG